MAQWLGLALGPGNDYQTLTGPPGPGNYRFFGPPITVGTVQQLPVIAPQREIGILVFDC